MSQPKDKETPRDPCPIVGQDELGEQVLCWGFKGHTDVHWGYPKGGGLVRWTEETK